MVATWKVVFAKQARRDAKKASSGGLRKKIEALLLVLQQDPYQTPPPFERLVGDVRGAYSRRINIQRRLVYQVFEDEKTVRVLRMWTHYE